MNKTINRYPQRKKEYFVTVRSFDRSALTISEKFDNSLLKRQKDEQEEQEDLVQNKTTVKDSPLLNNS